MKKSNIKMIEILAKKIKRERKANMPPVSVGQICDSPVPSDVRWQVLDKMKVIRVFRSFYYCMVQHKSSQRSSSRKPITVAHLSNQNC
jgi:hypothetical protein